MVTAPVAPVPPTYINTEDPISFEDMKDVREPLFELEEGKYAVGAITFAEYLADNGAFENPFTFVPLTGDDLQRLALLVGKPTDYFTNLQTDRGLWSGVVDEMNSLRQFYMDEAVGAIAEMIDLTGRVTVIEFSLLAAFQMNKYYEAVSMLDEETEKIVFDKGIDVFESIDRTTPAQDANWKYALSAFMNA
jgi:hypothetical protein